MVTKSPKTPGIRLFTIFILDKSPNGDQQKRYFSLTLKLSSLKNWENV